MVNPLHLTGLVPIKLQIPERDNLAVIGFCLSNLKKFCLFHEPSDKVNVSLVYKTMTCIATGFKLIDDPTQNTSLKEMARDYITELFQLERRSRHWSSAFKVSTDLKKVVKLHSS